ERCIEEVILLISSLPRRKTFDGHVLSSKVDAFQKAWRPHLDRAYLRDYEAIRWRFITDYVINRLEGSKTLGKCLDIGCGRGCVTSSLVKSGIATDATGIDGADFESEWRERRTTPLQLRYQQVSMRHMEDWVRMAGQFDTFLLLYVLHHSNDYRTARTLRSLHKSIRPGGRVIVLEDSLALDRAPLNDPFNLTSIWSEWANRDQVYCLTAGYDAQVILDFVAVQLLAGFREVSMACNYRLGTDWLEYFGKLGYETVQIENIGFPEKRDIDVPQAFFVLKSKV
ncbi:MAG: class I SAM-dependent methyltransferase, partial [Nitrososphaera sp.]|nr:class I SAM-dependent methyltransferase [Nitrososphaera sp.]